MFILTNKNKSYKIDIGNYKNVLSKAIKTNWFRDINIIKTKDSHLYVVQLTILGKILRQIASLGGKNQQFIKWAAHVQGQVLNKSEFIKVLENKISKTSSNLFQKISSTSDDVRDELQGQVLNKSEVIKVLEHKMSKISSNSFQKISSNSDDVRDELQCKIKDNLITDANLYHFLKSKQLGANHPYFLSNASTEHPTDLALEFSQARHQTIQTFMQTHYIQEQNETWTINASINNTSANENLLSNMIADINVSDMELYQFFKEHQIAPHQHWFIYENVETKLALAMKEKRKLDAHSFFNRYYLINMNASWKINSTANDGYNKNKSILSTLIQDEKISTQELLSFFKDIGIRPQGGWLQNEDGSPTELKEFISKNRPQLYQDLYSAIAKLDKIEVVQHQLLANPIEHLISINCHGSHAHHTFELPPHVYILVPHPQGFDKTYILQSPPNNITFEEMIYNRKDQQIPTPSSGGWHVYKPGEQVSNLELIPWSGSHDVNKEFENWKRRVPAEDILFVKASDTSPIPRFAVVPARDQFNNKLSYDKIEKTKVKVFGTTNLQEIIVELMKKNPNQPLVIAPFTCNAGTINEKVHCNSQKTTKIAQLF